MSKALFPMSKQDRLFLALNMNGFFESVGLKRELVENLLVSEAFWRGVVKTSDPFSTHREHGGDWKECRFCGGGWGPQHKQDCPWLLAQD